MRDEKAQNGTAVVISAPSGCGKTTVVHQLLLRNPGWGRSVSVTTRKPRAGEVHGEDYFFMSRKEFLAERRKKNFLEWAEVFGHYYGTPRPYVLGRIREGRHVILAIDVCGARKIRKKIKCLSIFLMPPSLGDLEKRLCRRQSDSRRVILRRLEHARFEISCAKEYDYVVVNRKVDVAVRAIENILKDQMQQTA